MLFKITVDDLSSGSTVGSDPVFVEVLFVKVERVLLREFRYFEKLSVKSSFVFFHKCQIRLASSCKCSVQHVSAFYFQVISNIDSVVLELNEMMIFKFGRILAELSLAELWKIFSSAELRALLKKLS